MKVFDPARYPPASRVGNAVCEAHQSAFSPEHSFEFGLEMILDGVARGEAGRLPLTTTSLAVVHDTWGIR